MQNKPLNKYFWLIDKLYVSSGLSREQINDLWSKCPLNESGESNIPETTFHHWKNSIRAILGIRINYNKRRDEYYLESGVEGSDNQYFGWMIRSLAVAEAIRNSSDLQDRVVLESMPSGERWLYTILDAMRANKVLEMMYKPFEPSEIHTMQFKPYCLKSFKQRWYIVGKSSNHPEPYRVYALDRIVGLEPTGKTFRMPKSFNAEALFHDLYGVWLGTDRKVETVRISARNQEANYLRTLPLHHSQQELGPSDGVEGWTDFKWRIKVTYDFIMELRSRGRNLRIIEPQWLKDEI